jgi:hypothetical protein
MPKPVSQFEFIDLVGKWSGQEVVSGKKISLNVNGDKSYILTIDGEEYRGKVSLTQDSGNEKILVFVNAPYTSLHQMRSAVDMTLKIENELFDLHRWFPSEN